MNTRTDLALELKPDIESKTGGVSASREHYGEVEITTIEVENEIGERLLGKPKGTYISFGVGSFLQAEDASMALSIITSRLKSLFPKKWESALVVGLGNRDITPDALGPQTVQKVLATRHIRQELGAVEELDKLRSVAVLAPGVLGKTGIETLDIIRGAIKAVRPSFVIAVDAFAARGVERLGNTVQIASSGICPGSGVKNARKALNEKSLGVPVISIGVPTVVDAGSLIAAFGNAPEETAAGAASEMFVTPREIDSLISRSASLLSRVLNSALQPRCTLEQIEALMS